MTHDKVFFIAPDFKAEVCQPAGMGKESGIFFQNLEIPVKVESQYTIKNKMYEETDYHFLA